MQNLKNALFSFSSAFIFFVIFALDYTYDKDLFTWVPLLVSICWWTIGMLCSIKHMIYSKL